MLHSVTSMYRLPTVLLAALLTACGGGTPSTPSTSRVGSSPVVGPWGGTHVGLVLTDSGGTVEYDCASGGLSVPVRPAASGEFQASGFHVRGQGGPVRIDERVDSLPARYLGMIEGDAMSLRVVVGTDTLGPYTLTRGSAPRIFRCL